MQFDLIPTANRVPGPMAEVDGSRALSTQSAEPHTVLIIGKRLTTGTALANEIKPIVGEFDGDKLFDSASELGAMCRAFKRINRTADVYAVGVDEAAAGVQATGTFVFTGTTTQQSSMRLRVGDQRVDVGAAAGTDANAIATAAAAAINKLARCPVTAAAAAGTVTTTHRTKGTSGNDVTLAYEVLPAGITCTVASPSNGAADPSLDTLIGLLDETRYDTIVSGFNDAANIALLEAEMDRRWGPRIKHYGMIIAAKGGTHSAATTYGAARNSNKSCIMPTGASPTPPWVWAAQVAARDAAQCDLMPNQPRNGLTLPDVEAPPRGALWDSTQNNLLLYSGMSTYKVDQSGRVMIERLITTYQKDASNMADATYLAMETMRNLAGYLIEALQVGAKYSRHVIGGDLDAFGEGVPVATPGGLKGEFVAHYETMVLRGRMRDLDGFAKELVIVPSVTDVERFDIQLPPRFMNGLVTIAMKVSFQL